MTQDEIITLIKNERERQYNLPGIEFDVRNSPGEWSSIVGHYIFEDIRKGSIKPSRQSYEDGLIKAAAVIIAALEHCDKMDANNHFSK